MDTEKKIKELEGETTSLKRMLLKSMKNMELLARHMDRIIYVVNELVEIEQKRSRQDEYRRENKRT